MSTVQPGWWISWYSPHDLASFELHSPWWVSGYGFEENEDGDLVEVPTIVAAVRAENEDAAWDLIYSAYDDRPGDIEQRFCEPLDAPAFTDRFPKADWMAWGSDGRTCQCGACV